MLSHKLKLFLKWLFPFAFMIGGIGNMANDFTLAQEVGINSKAFLLAHGITQPILGAALITAGMIMFAFHVERAKKPVSVIDPKSAKAIKQMQAIEKKYGADWMDRIDAMLLTLKDLGSGSKKN
jgi:hypothetical protein